ncbi:MAG TPA: hypothetical protein VF174_11465 [Micromonosporaceae bacterium]
MNLADVMDEIAARLATIDGLRCYAWPVPKISPPAAVVGFPEDITYDATYGRGMDQMTVPVVLLAGRVGDRPTRDVLAAHADGSGARSVKAVLESATWTAFETVRVTGAQFDPVTIAGVDYEAAVFTLDIAGQGSS